MKAIKGMGNSHTNEQLNQKNDVKIYQISEVPYSNVANEKQLLSIEKQKMKPSKLLNLIHN